MIYIVGDSWNDAVRSTNTENFSDNYWAFGNIGRVAKSYSSTIQRRREWIIIENTKDKITIFENEEFGKVRTLLINGEPWFVGKDICNVFGDTNHSRTLSRVDDEDKQSIEILDNIGRTQKPTVVNESGLYSILFSMQPQKANKRGMSNAYPIETQKRIDKLKHFKRWVTHDVLPTIRKTGGYINNCLLYTSDAADEL